MINNTNKNLVGLRVPLLSFRAPHSQPEPPRASRRALFKVREHEDEGRGGAKGEIGRGGWLQTSGQGAPGALCTALCLCPGAGRLGWDHSYIYIYISGEASQASRLPSVRHTSTRRHAVWRGATTATRTPVQSAKKQSPLAKLLERCWSDRRNSASCSRTVLEVLPFFQDGPLETGVPKKQQLGGPVFSRDFNRDQHGSDSASRCSC